MFNRSFRDKVLEATLSNSIAEAKNAAEISVIDYN